jgi:hypothetical protein
VPNFVYFSQYHADNAAQAEGSSRGKNSGETHINSQNVKSRQQRMLLARRRARNKYQRIATGKFKTLFLNLLNLYRHLTPEGCLNFGSNS